MESRMKPKVFGIGLNKTGTTTLGSIMMELGYRHRSCDRLMLRDYQAGNLAKVRSKIDKYESFEDWPYPLMYEHLWDWYGDKGARFICTMREDSRIWYSSLVKHARDTKPFNHCRRMVFGFAYPTTNEEMHREFYDEHLKNVKTFFSTKEREDRIIFLNWRDTDARIKLAEFLNQPESRISIQHMNKTSSRKKKPMRRLINEILAKREKSAYEQMRKDG